MFKAIERQERRRRRLILAGWRLFRERRRRVVAHFINDRRLANQRRRARAIWIGGLLMLSAAIWLYALTLQPAGGALLTIAWDLALITIFYIKPYKRISLTAS